MRRLVACCLLFALSGAACAAPPEFPLGHHGTIALPVPEGWAADLRGSTSPEAYAILLTPKRGTHFEVLLDIPFPPTASAKLPDRAEMRAEVTGAAREAAQHAVEHSLPLQDLAGPAVYGYYFRATDRAPLPGEYKYLTQGMSRAGALVLAFTILTNDGQDEVPEAALEMIRNAAHHPDGTSGAAPPPPEPKQ